MKKRSFVFGAQSDVACFKQSVGAVKEWILFLEKFNISTYYMYCEAGVRTKSFSFGDPAKTYSEAEMRELVRFSDKHHVKLVPIFEFLGHAQKFLQTKELHKLSEEREIKGRAETSFCPSLPATYKFLEKFIDEIMDIFTSDVIHAGCDECAMCLCSKCKERVAKGETRGSIYTDHLLWLYGQIVKKHKRRMIVWDDMFEQFPEQLKRIPKDLELMPWEYDTVVDAKTAKLGDRPVINCFRKYSKLGIKAAHGGGYDGTFSNPYTFARYCERSKEEPSCAGFSLTSWHPMKYVTYPMTAYAARLFQSRDLANDAEVYRKAMIEIFGKDMPPLFAALRSAKDNWKDNENIYLDSWSTGFKQGFKKSSETTAYADLSKAETNAAVLEDYLDKVPKGMPRRIVEDTLAVSLETVLNFSFVKWTDLCVSERSVGHKVPSSKYIRSLIEKVYAIRKKQVDTYDKTKVLDYTRFLPNKEKLLARVDEFEKMFRTHDQFMEVRTREQWLWTFGMLSATLNGEKVWQSGPVWPECISDNFFHTIYVPVKNAKEGELKIQTSTRLPIYVSHVRIYRAGMDDLVPVKVVAQVNYASNAENILKNDYTLALLGTEDRNAKPFAGASYITLEMASAEDPELN